MTALKATSAVSASIEDRDAIGLAMVWPGRAGLMQARPTRSIRTGTDRR